MQWRIGLLLLAVLLNLVYVGAVRSQTICIDRIEMLDRLANDYDEHLTEVRLSDEGLMEFIVSDGGTYTLILTQPWGTSCVIATGEGLDIDPLLLVSSEGFEL